MTNGPTSFFVFNRTRFFTIRVEKLNTFLSALEKINAEPEKFGQLKIRNDAEHGRIALWTVESSVLFSELPDPFYTNSRFDIHRFLREYADPKNTVIVETLSFGRDEDGLRWAAYVECVIDGKPQGKLLNPADRYYKEAVKDQVYGRGGPAYCAEGSELISAALPYLLADWVDSKQRRSELPPFEFLAKHSPRPEPAPTDLVRARAFFDSVGQKYNVEKRGEGDGFTIGGFEEEPAIETVLYLNLLEHHIRGWGGNPEVTMAFDKDGKYLHLGAWD